MAIYADKPWLRYYDDGVPPHIDFPAEPMHAQLERTAKKYPNKAATLSSAKLPLLGRVHASQTWKEIDEAASSLAAALVDMGLRKGDGVAIILPNTTQFIIAFYAISKAGGVVVAMNPTYPPQRMAYQVGNAGARFMICMTLFYEDFKSVQDQTKVERCIVTNYKEYLPPLAQILFTLAIEKKEGHYLETVRDNDVWLQDVLKHYTPDQQPTVEIDATKDIALIQYTGGTTGISKGAMSTHYAIAANAQMLASWFNSPDPSAEMFLGALPFFHVYGLITIVVYACGAGATIAIVPNARNVEDVIDTLAHFKATMFVSVPALYNAINNHELVKEGKVDLSSLKYCFSGSAPLAPDTKRTFEALAQVPILEGFGMSEAPTATHANPLKGSNKIQSIGVPLPDIEAQIISLDDGETPMPVGEPGELVMRGPNIMLGYLGMPTETNNALRDLGDGGAPWLFTGDIAYMDEQGYFFIVDRKKDMALIGGFNVYPTMVEKALADHEAVLEVGVTAIPHPTRQGQEALLACVVLHDGFTGDQALIDDLVAFQGQSLTPNETARRIVFVDELPKTAVGKTLRRELSRLASEAMNGE